VANTMFMSVLERTREIGVLKSIGATSGQIQGLFLMESALIGLSGGLLGLFAGLFLVFLLSVFSFHASISLEMALVAFAVSVSVGIIAGTYPAKRASEIPAVEALRYE
ncbi:MAG: FtsX-like permease family protein, partial [Candidatus Bilamarchaeaceae archaeon]